MLKKSRAVLRNSGIRTTRYRQFRLSWLVLILTLTATSLWKVDAFAAQPDMSNVDDILQGDLYLLRDDDIAFVQAFSNQNTGDYGSLQIVAPTSNSGFATPSSNIIVQGFPPPGFNPESAITIGRFYNSPNDIILTAGEEGQNGEQNSWFLNVHDVKSGVNFNQGLPSFFSPSSPRVGMQLVKGDFYGAGFDDAAIIYFTGDSPRQVAISLIIPSDPQTNDSLLVVTPPLTASTSNGLVPETGTLVAGDFAGGSGMPNSNIFGLAALLSDNQTVQFYTVTPNLQITPGESIKLPQPLGSGNVPLGIPAALVAGRFRGTNNDELAVVGTTGGGGIGIVSIAIDPATLKPTIVQTAQLQPGTSIATLAAEAAPLTGMFGVRDQLVLGYTTTNSAGIPDGIVQIGSFDDTFTFQSASYTSLDQGSSNACVLDVAPGNFDNRNGGGQRLPNPELAVFVLQGPTNNNFACVTSSPVSNSFKLAAQIFQLNTASSSWLLPNPSEIVLNGFIPAGDVAIHSRMAIGDLQGRSLRLGAPDKVTIEGQLQPDIVLGIPPMHVDYVNPNFVFNQDTHPGCQSPPTPCNLNLTVRPSVPAPSTGFSTQFNFSSSTSTSSSRRNTTSFGLAVQGTAEAGYSYGLPGVASVSVQLKTSLKYTHDHRVSKAYNTYSSKSDSLSATTGFADHIFFSQSRQNIYYYPVLGQMTCPSTTPNCTSDQMTQLYVDFSAPDRVTKADLDDTTLDWYQPGHEPGNVLTYPWDESQLQGQFSDTLAPQTTTPAPCRGTDTSETAYSTSWSGASQQSKTSGSANAFSTDTSLSVTGDA
ncbi:MAG: hypothetical protein ABSD31_18890, partial [Candidatus Binataceae bacterium]